MAKKDKVKIVEVGARDGLQNEKKKLSLDIKEQLIRRLADAGLKKIEVGAFVSPKWVPQMSESLELTKEILSIQSKGEIHRDVEFSCLVPNRKGMEAALESGIKEISIFGACTETFSKKNINCSVAESFIRFKEIMDLAKDHKIKVRGYLSTAFGCPFEGKVAETRVVRLVRAMLKLGVYEVSIGDTIGVATPRQVESVLKKIKRITPLSKIAMHFHDTRGTALSNVLAAYQQGVKTFDSSVGGLGGCPYAPGAAGNLATEDLLYFLMGMGLSSSIDLQELISIRKWIEKELDHKLPAKVSDAGVSALVLECITSGPAQKS